MAPTVGKYGQLWCLQDMSLTCRLLCPGRPVERRHKTGIKRKPHGYSKHKLRMGLVMGEFLQQQPGGIHSFASQQEQEGCGCDLQHRDIFLHMTLDLLRRNHQLQQKLNLLQAETHAFLDSLLLNVPPDQAEE